MKKEFLCKHFPEWKAYTLDGVWQCRPIYEKSKGASIRSDYILHNPILQASKPYHLPFLLLII